MQRYGTPPASGHADEFPGLFPSLNLRMRVRGVVREPLDIPGVGDPVDRKRRVEPSPQAPGSSWSTGRSRLSRCRSRHRSSTCSPELNEHTASPASSSAPTFPMVRHLSYPVAVLYLGFDPAEPEPVAEFEFDQSLPDEFD